MIRMAMGGNDQINISDPYPQLSETDLNMAEQTKVAGVYDQASWAIDKVGITIIC
jgi:hypothetical protein